METKPGGLTENEGKVVEKIYGLLKSGEWKYTGQYLEKEYPEENYRLSIDAFEDDEEKRFTLSILSGTKTLRFIKLAVSDYHSCYYMDKIIEIYRDYLDCYRRNNRDSMAKSFLEDMFGDKDVEV